MNTYYIGVDGPRPWEVSIYNSAGEQELRVQNLILHIRATGEATATLVYLDGTVSKGSAMLMPGAKLEELKHGRTQ